MAFTLDGESLDYRFKITVDKNKISSNLTNFPCMFDLSNAPALFWIHVKSTAGDIRVSQGDGTTRQAVEVGYFASGSSLGIIYFKGSSISSSLDEDFYVYYGNAALSQPGVGTTYGSENVWKSDFLSVLHFNEDPSGGAPQILDSTSNSLDGTTYGTMTSGDLVAAQVGQGLDFDGTDDRVETPTTGASMTLGAVSFLVQVPSNTATEHMFEFYTGDADRHLVYFDTSGGVFRFTSNAITAPTVSGGTFTNKWWHVVAQWDSSEPTEKRKIKVNGGAWATHTTLPTVTLPATLLIAAQKFSGVYYEGFGIWDEFRMVDAAQSEAWFDAEAANLLDVGTFYSAVGAEEENGGPASGANAIFAAANF